MIWTPETRNENGKLVSGALCEKGNGLSVSDALGKMGTAEKFSGESVTWRRKLR